MYDILQLPCSSVNACVCPKWFTKESFLPLVFLFQLENVVLFCCGNVPFKGHHDIYSSISRHSTFLPIPAPPKKGKDTPHSLRWGFWNFQAILLISPLNLWACLRLCFETVLKDSLFHLMVLHNDSYPPFKLRLIGAVSSVCKGWRREREFCLVFWPIVVVQSSRSIKGSCFFPSMTISPHSELWITEI